MDPAPSPAPDATVSWWRWATAVAILAFLVAHVVEIALVRFDGRAYLTLREWWGSPAGRIAASVVVVSVLVHGLSGLVAAWGTLVGEPTRIHDPRTRAALWFGVLAAGVPLVVVTMWPWLRTL